MTYLMDAMRHLVSGIGDADAVPIAAAVALGSA
jgi:hypothetical protein